MILAIMTGTSSHNILVCLYMIKLNNFLILNIGVYTAEYHFKSLFCSWVRQEIIQIQISFYYIGKYFGFLLYVGM